MGAKNQKWHTDELNEKEKLPLPSAEVKRRWDARYASFALARM